jgi:hypothetical protein
MQTIFYPGYLNQPCQAQYGIAISRDEDGARADIVVIESSGESGQHHTSLLDTAAGRNLLLNKILATDLRGVELNRTRFFVISDPESPFDLLGHEFPMVMNFADYERRGNPVEVKAVRPSSIKEWIAFGLGCYWKSVSALNSNVVGGCAMVETDRRPVRRVMAEEARALVIAAGYRARWAYPGLRLVSSLSPAPSV